MNTKQWPAAMAEAQLQVRSGEKPILQLSALGEYGRQNTEVALKLQTQTFWVRMSLLGKLSSLMGYY